MEENNTLEKVAIDNGRAPDWLGKHNVFSRLASILMFIAFGILIYFGFFSERLINADLVFYIFVGVWIVFLSNRSISLVETITEIFKTKFSK